MASSRIISHIEYSAVRSIPPKTRGNRGLFPSRKVQKGVVEYESQLERDFFLVLEHAPDVKLYQHQPFKIIYTDDQNNTHAYVPDVYVEFTIGLRILVEIKDEDTYNKDFEKNKLKWNAAEEWTKQRGIIFLVLTEREIRTPRMATIWFTLGSSKCSENDKYMNKLTDLIPSNGASYEFLCKETAQTLGIPLGKAAQIICFAIYWGIVFVDTFSTQLLSKNTIIRRRLSTIKEPPFQPLWEELDLTLEQRTVQTNINDINEPKSLTILELPEKYKKYEQLVEIRLKIVREWIKQPKDLRSEDWKHDFIQKWKTKLETEEKFEMKLSVRSVQRWTKKFKEKGIYGLIPHYTGRKKKQYSPTLLELMEEARKIYLQPDTTLQAVLQGFDEYEGFLKKCEKAKIPPEEIPSEITLYRFIREATSASELARTRRGRQYHKSHFTATLGSFQGAIMPMQVLQLDNTRFDVFPVDSKYREVLPTPYLTAAIDCYTRMITGAYLSLAPSSSQSILDTLVQSILPKNDYIQQFEAQISWPIQGFPVLILVDNGMDYRSKAVKEFCIKYDIILEFAPLRTPRYKAYIEQWFNTLHKGLVEEKVAGYRYYLKQRLENRDLNPEGKAVLTMQETESWFYKWILDKYHFTNPYDDLVPAPVFRWEDVVEGETEIILPIAREAPKERWEITLLHLSTLTRKERVLDYEGVVWKYLQYNNNELRKIYNRKGRIKVILLIDRRDVRQLWVENPIDGQPILVGLTPGWWSAILEVHGDRSVHASAWKAEIKLVKLRHKDRVTPYIYKMEKSRLLRQQIVSKAKKDTKQTRKTQAINEESERKSTISKLDEDIPQDGNEEEEPVEDVSLPPASVLPTSDGTVSTHMSKQKKDEDEEEEDFKLPKAKTLPTSDKRI
ncbi:MAG: TnsA endonuclease N-terminal domain-containing protein [Promethearchaeota archaeon]